MKITHFRFRPPAKKGPITLHLGDGIGNYRLVTRRGLQMVAGQPTPIIIDYIDREIRISSLLDRRSRESGIAAAVVDIMQHAIRPGVQDLMDELARLKGGEGRKSCNR